METLKDAGRFALGCLLLVSLIPPALVIGVALMFAPIDRSAPDDGPDAA